MALATTIPPSLLLVPVFDPAAHQLISATSPSIWVPLNMDSTVMRLGFHAVKVSQFIAKANVCGMSIIIWF